MRTLFKQSSRRAVDEQAAEDELANGLDGVGRIRAAEGGKTGVDIFSDHWNLPPSSPDYLCEGTGDCTG